MDKEREERRIIEDYFESQHEYFSMNQHRDDQIESELQPFRNENLIAAEKLLHIVKDNPIFSEARCKFKTKIPLERELSIQCLHTLERRKVLEIDERDRVFNGLNNSDAESIVKKILGDFKEIYVRVNKTMLFQFLDYSEDTLFYGLDPENEEILKKTVKNIAPLLESSQKRIMFSDLKDDWMKNNLLWIADYSGMVNVLYGNNKTAANVFEDVIGVSLFVRKQLEKFVERIKNFLEIYSLNNGLLKKRNNIVWECSSCGNVIVQIKNSDVLIKHIRILLDKGCIRCLNCRKENCSIKIKG